MAETKEHLVGEVGRAMQDYQWALEEFDQRVARRLGLNRTDMRCLELLFAGEPMSPGDLAAAAGLTTAGVTTAIDRLERAGYAVRVRDTTDRRRAEVRVTEECQRQVGEIFAPLVAEGAAYLRRLDRPTLAHLANFLRFATRLQRDHAQRLENGA